ncbi:MAG: arylsulfatase [Bryobacteraceae bacterium]|nr:MAG: arylsulfatase [Bryobacteraceae bacterium]
MRLDRRTFLGAAAGACSAGLVHAARRRQNFVLIYADDLGYGDLGCYGHPTIRTPNLDRMAAEGAKFMQWYSAAPLCTPSRAALLTGRYAVRSGLTRVLFPDSTGGIPDSETTIAEVLKGAGYQTAAIGKWHLGHLPPYLPTRHGFDSYYGIPYSNDMRPLDGPGAPGAAKYPPLPLMRDEKVIETEPDQAMLTPRYTEEAVRKIRAFRGRPFFLYYAQTYPHVPLYASPRFRGRSARGIYGDVVEEIDWSVGEILRALAETGQERNTLVVFTSDNGPWLQRQIHAGSAGLLREGKATTWEGGVRVPFIVRQPGRVQPRRTSGQVGSMLDLLPTFAAMAGAGLPSRTLDGEDLSRELCTEAPPRERTLFYWNAEQLCAVRHGPWKLHRISNTAEWKSGTSKHDPPLLFHLEHDPSEKYDVAAAHPDVVQRLSAMMEERGAKIERGPAQR